MPLKQEFFTLKDLFIESYADPRALSLSIAQIWLMCPKKSETSSSIRLITFGSDQVADQEAADFYPAYIPQEDGSRKPNFSKELINQISRNMDLLFLPEPERGQVCYATNNADMLDAFKTVYTPEDLIYYLYGALREETEKKNLRGGEEHIPFPESSDFWEKINQAKKS